MELITKKLVSETKDISSVQLNDVICFTLKNGEKVEAVAVEQNDNIMTFCMVDCVKKEYLATGPYSSSKFRRAINSDIPALFPDELHERLYPYENRDLFSIPNFDGVFTWEYLKDRRNLVAMYGLNENPTSYPVIDDSGTFRSINEAGTLSKSYYRGISHPRLCFKLKLF